MTAKFGGCLVVLEGIDRAGKSSVTERMPDLLYRCRPGIVVCSERDSPIGRWLEPAALTELSPFLKTYLFAADRASVFERECLPALKSGRLVVWDRYVASALAYRAVDLAQPNELFDMTLVNAINEPFPEPDLTVFIDISPQTSAERARRDGRAEPYSTEYLARVREAYLRLLSRLSNVVVDGEREPDEVARQVAKEVSSRFPEFFDES